MIEADRMALATEALGFVLIRSQIVGDYVFVIDAASLPDAQRAWPGTLVFTPIEIKALEAYCGDDASLREICRWKRLTDGTVIEVRMPEALAA